MSGSTLGTLFCVTTFGESHGPAIGCVVDGCPPGMELSEADIQPDLDRRRPGTSRHVTQRKEEDKVEILSGVFEGCTTGTPIALLIRNTDQRSKDYANLLDTFRPGHADYTYHHKYGRRDPRGGGRASARLTAPAVGAAAIAKKWLRERCGTTFFGHLAAIGDIAIPFEGWEHVANNPFFAANASDIARIEAYVDELTPAGFASNNAGGVLGGIATGQDITVSLAIKPTSSIRTPRRSIDRAGQPTMVETFGRHDPCVGIRATPIAEAMLALVVMDHVLRHRQADVAALRPVAPIPAQAP